MNQLDNPVADHSDLIRKRKRKKNYVARRRLKIVGIVLGIILGVCLLAALALFILNLIGKESFKSPVYDEGKVVYHDGKKYVYNDNIISTLIIGYDQTPKSKSQGKNGQADFILLITIDTETGKIKGISVPRDTMIEVGEYAGSAFLEKNKKIQIDTSFGYGDGKHKSCELTLDCVSRLLYNMPIKHYAALNLEGIGPLNNAIGGVNLVPIETIPNTSITKGDKITLMGKNAESYVRYRNVDNLASSEQRRNRQVQYVTEFYKQAFSSSNGMQTALDLFNVANNYVITNIGLPEFTYLAQTVLSKGLNDFQIAAIPGTISEGGGFAEFNADMNKVFELVLDTFYTQEE